MDDLAIAFDAATGGVDLAPPDATGDLTTDPTPTAADILLLLKRSKGQTRRFPLAGVGLPEFINASGAALATKLRARIIDQLTRDGLELDQPVAVALVGEQLAIQAIYATRPHLITNNA